MPAVLGPIVEGVPEVRLWTGTQMLTTPSWTGCVPPLEGQEQDSVHHHELGVQEETRHCKRNNG